MALGKRDYARYVTSRFGGLKLSHAARFSAVGGLATVVHIGVAMVAVAAAGTSPAVGTMIGFVTAFPFSYTGHFIFAASGRYRNYLLKFCRQFAGAVLAQYGGGVDGDRQSPL